MEIIELSHYSVPHIGGIESVIDTLQSSFTQLGHRVTHISSAAGHAIARPGVRTTPAWNGLERANVPYPVFSPGLFPLVRRTVAPADVVHAHGLLYMPTVAAAHARRTARRPVFVVTEHVGHVLYESRFLDRVQALAYRTVARFTGRIADCVVVLNDKVRDEVRSLLPHQRIETITNGLDLDRYHPVSRSVRCAELARLGWADVPRVIFVGRLVPKKGIHVAIEAARRGQGEFELVVVGPGTLAGENLPPNVRLMGPMPPEVVARLYRVSDAFLLPSHGEGFPVSAQEAMASGLPAILGDDENLRQFAGLAGAGMVLVERHPDAVLRAIREVLACGNAPEAALGYAQRTWSGRRAAQHYIDLFHDLGVAA
jgi:glycosyltransferase involved in cell wall biosynthesis